MTATGGEAAAGGTAGLATSITSSNGLLSTWTPSSEVAAVAFASCASRDEAMEDAAEASEARMSALISTDPAVTASSMSTALTPASRATDSRTAPRFSSS